MIHGAIIQIDNELLLEFLDFKGGKIHKVYTPHNYWLPRVFNVVVEHPDLPEVEPSEELVLVTPTYEVTQNQFGVRTSINRVDPPKRNGLEKLKSETPSSIK